METEVEVKLEVKEEFSELMDRLNSEDIPERVEAELTLKSSSLSRCRLCALPKNNMVDIFNTSETEDDNIVERIQYCLRIVVKETDTLPKQACRSCLEELELCYQFNKIVEEAEAQLLNLDRQISAKLAVSEQNGQSSLEPTVKSSDTDIPKIESLASPVKTESNEPPTLVQEGQVTDETVKISPLLPSLKVRYRVPVFTETQCGNNFKSVKRLVPHNGVQRTDKSRPRMTRNRSRTKISILRSGKGFEESENQADAEEADTRKTERCKDSERSNECSLCKKTLNTFLELQRHKRAHLENGDYHCSPCNKFFKNEGRMRQHMIVHSRKPWRCNHCDKQCDFKSTLERHLNSCRKRRVHNHEQWRCDYCDKQCEFKRVLERHLNSCKKRPNIVEELHECGSCTKVFKTKDSLRKHYNKCHRGTGFYSCQYCGMKFTSKTERDCHRRVHKEERPFECTICGWMFADSRGLRLHETLHLKKTTHRCSVCDKTFRSLSRMKSHMARHSTESHDSETILRIESSSEQSSVDI